MRRFFSLKLGTFKWMSKESIHKILAVVNPISGDQDKEDMIDCIREHLNEGQELQLLRTSGEKDLEAIQKQLDADTPDRVLVVGGDGTIKLVVEALGDRNQALGIIPAGSSNGLATALDLPLDWREAVGVALGDHSKPLDVLQINNELSVHISDFGVNAALIEEYSASRIRGKFGYMINTVPALIKADYPYTFTIKTGEETRTVQGIMLAIANGRKFGTGAQINPRGDMHDGLFEILVFKNLDVIQILQTLQDQEELDPDFAECWQTDQASIRCDRPVPFQIDGEPAGRLEEVQVKMLKHRVRIVSP
ncbi:diacylglycerol/lipid kinase family protein [Croceiramulus getboli]|nr:diacylglycerol kinase family protein [Flavobacteriaceae bacterium YJPT1-3]